MPGLAVMAAVTAMVGFGPLIALTSAIPMFGFGALIALTPAIPTFGLLITGARGPMLRFGGRTKFCACATGLTASSAVNASAARHVGDRQLAAPCILAPRYK